MTPAEIMRLKELLPTSLGSEEIREQIATDILQRSIFSARMESAHYLKRLREVCTQLLAGEINQSTARADLGSLLEQMGHSAEDGALTNPASERRLQLIEIDIPQTRVRHIRRNRSRTVRRPDRTGHKSGLVRRFQRHRIAFFARHLRSRDAKLFDMTLKSIIGKRNPLQTEAVRLDDVGARLQISAMNRRDHLRLRQHER